MEQGQQDKRATRRFSLQLPISVKYQNGAAGEKSAITKDVSARGICFYMDSPLGEGSQIEFTLTLPPEITLTESIRVRCKGKVVRAEPSTNTHQLRIAAVINEYEFLSAAQDTAS
jgi:hypothetical protein